MLKYKSIDLAKTKAAVLAVAVCEDAELYSEDILKRLTAKAKGKKSFDGKKSETIVFHDPEEVRADSVLFFGLGKAEEIDAEAFRTMAGKAVKKCMNLKQSEILFAVPMVKDLKMDKERVLEAMMEGAFLANHVFDKYKQKKKNTPLKNIFFNVTRSEAKSHKNLPARVTAVCSGTKTARDWVNTPSNDKRPVQLAAALASAGKKAGLDVKVMDEKALKRNKFGALLSVCAGSGSKPRMVVLSYSPPKPSSTVVLVGKGVTFDSGGYNLKPGSSMDTMKIDMSGAAAVTAAIISLSALKPKKKIVAVIPIVENMVSGNATRPGDIVKAYNGKTVEINNTDAEGRLILADAIAWAEKTCKPDVIIDAATLTGACVVALGEGIAGIFTADNELADTILAAGEHTHERCWRMPLPEDYRELLKSDTADLSNISSSRWGGAITAALFLSEFVIKARWAHIDIAGPAYVKKAGPYGVAGATGFGVRLLCDVVERLP